MSRLIERVAVVITWSLVSLILSAVVVQAMIDLGQPPRPSWEGRYTCRGIDLDGRTYEGAMLAIEPRGTEGVYAVLWQMPDGGEMPGVGLSDEQHLAVAYVAERTIGVVIYVTDGRTLQGRWTAYGVPDGRTSTETCRATPRQEAQH